MTAEQDRNAIRNFRGWETVVGVPSEHSQISLVLLTLLNCWSCSVLRSRVCFVV